MGPKSKKYKHRHLTNDQNESPHHALFFVGLTVSTEVTVMMLNTTNTRIIVMQNVMWKKAEVHISLSSRNTEVRSSKKQDVEEV